MIALIEAPQQAKQRRLTVTEALTEAEHQLYDRTLGEVDFVPHPSFSLPQTEDDLFGDRAQAVDIPKWTSFLAVPDDGGPCPRSKRVNLSAKDEARLFLRYNYARHRLRPLVEAQRRRETVARAKEIVLWCRRAMKARTDIVQANLPLVAAMAKRTTVRNVERTELIGEGNMALLRSVDKFDVSRGFRFSTYACRAILKSFSRLAAKAGRYRKAFPIEYDPELDPSDYDVRKHEMQRREAIESLTDLLERNRANLTRLERTIVEERYGLVRRGRRRTLTEVGKRVGLTSERVRQLQNLALAKMRSALAGVTLAS